MPPTVSHRFQLQDRFQYNSSQLGSESIIHFTHKKYSLQTTKVNPREMAATKLGNKISGKISQTNRK